MKRQIVEKSREQERSEFDKAHSENNVKKLMEEIEKEKENLQKSLALANMRANERV